MAWLCAPVQLQNHQGLAVSVGQFPDIRVCFFLPQTLIKNQSKLVYIHCPFCNYISSLDSI